jgi:hypothetical protein
MLFTPRKDRILYFRLLFMIILLNSLCGFSATADIIRGRVTDADTGEPLAFVHIVIPDTRQGTMTDIDGYFNLTLGIETTHLQLSYVGYFSKIHDLTDIHAFQEIRMQHQQIELDEVVIYPGDNPAHRIIRNATANRSNNHPERLASFTYKSYNKFVATLDRDYYMEKWMSTGNPASKNLADLLDQRHIFIMESATERKFRYPNRNNETIVANRVSGLENPLFSMLATELQSFSFYGNYITLLERDYVSPLNPTAFSRYFFNLEDTLYQDPDTVFVVTYRPVQGVNFDGLEGVLYINTHNWALQNVIARPYRQIQAGLNFRIQQQYDLVDGKNWFPVQLNTDIDFTSAERGSPGRFPPVRMLSRSYIRDISVNPSLSRSDFTMHGIDFDPQANKTEPGYWDQLRQDTLSQKESNTYFYMDSLGRAHNFDAIFNLVEPLVFGEIPFGIFSLPLNRFYNYNKYERHRIGLGLETNRRLSDRFRIGGYYAWSTGDKEHKYKYFGEVVLDKFSDLRAGWEQSYDVSERGGTLIEDNYNLLSPMYIRNLYRGTMDITKRKTAYLSFRSWMNFIQTKLMASTGKTQWYDDYLFLAHEGNQEIRNFRFSELSVHMRFAYGETLMNTPMRLISLSSPYPVFYFHAAKGFDRVFGSEFDYLRLEARLDVHYPVSLWGRQSWILESGWINRDDMPWPLLHTGRAGDKRALVASPFSFGTMHMNEFVSNRYFSVFFQHNFESLLFRTPGYEPELVLITNLGWGSTVNTDLHQNVLMKSWEKGYFESGFAINKIFPQRWVRRIVFGISPGIEVLYRYGPYSFEKVSDNITVKLSLVTSF